MAHYQARALTKIKECNELPAQYPKSMDQFIDIALYNLNVSGSVYTQTNDVEIFTDGEKLFADMMEEMKNAKEYIHVQYYIIKNDFLFQQIAEILVQKVREGVEVRLLYDGMGCRSLGHRLVNQLKDAGAKVAVFFPALLWWFHLRMNYRNHRKIVVIDGKTAYVGGMNIGKEYVSKDPSFGYWRDTHLKLWGPSVIALQIRFALDWNFAAEENLFTSKKMFIEHYLPEHIQADKGIQIISSGPDSSTPIIRDTYLQMMHKAEHHIYIQTPYFIPDDTILSALTIAAQTGVDVRLMIPCKPDHPFVYWATYSYMGNLLEAGAKCYTYENGFLHAKGVCVDGKVCCYGTANMDIRSFELNFEVNAMIYDEKTAKEMDRIFLEDLKNCKEITLKMYRSRSVWIRMKEQVSRLLSPLL
jgi:cardiolipin synthase